MDKTPEGVGACPYCGRRLQWVADRWFRRGCFECEQCGEFPDLRNPRLALNASDFSRRPSRIPPKRDDRPRVLMVDDSPESCDLYALMLEQMATVITASRGEDALAIARTEPLDVIVLDVMMPVMDGWEVCRRLKSSPATSGIPVIMLTSLDGGEVAAPGHRAGAAAVLMKPCPSERLALAIEAALRPQVESVADPVDNAPGFSAHDARPHPIAPPKVLIVDDDESTREGLAELVSVGGYQVLTAGTFPDAAQALNSTDPDLLIADVRLGEFNGLQLVATKPRAIPTIVVTGFADPVIEDEAHGLGAEYMVKPVVPSALLDMIERKLHASASRPPVRRWKRKRVTTAIPTYVDESPARILDVSYGGVRVEIDRISGDIPPSFDVSFPTSRLSVHVDVIWKSQRNTKHWLCGAQVSAPNPLAAAAWRGLVDAIP